MKKSSSVKTSRTNTLLSALLSLSILFGTYLYSNKSGYKLTLKKNGGVALWRAPLLNLDKESLSLPSEEIVASFQPKEKELKALLSQKFVFLGRGVQSIVFLGEDGKTVLKLFKNYRYYTHDSLLSLPLPSFLHKLIATKTERRKSRATKFYRSCVLAAYEVPEITGVNYIHLFPTKDLNVTLRLQDRLGATHLTKADSVQFLLQKNLTVADTLAKKFIQQEDRLGFEDMLIATEAMMLERYLHGLIDNDFAFHKNVGFLEDKAILLDFGSLLKRDLSDPLQAEELVFFAKKELKDLQALLIIHYPDAAGWIHDFFKSNPSHLEFCRSVENLKKVPTSSI